MQLPRILIIRTDFLGDSVLSSTVIKALSAQQIVLDIVCDAYNYTVFEFNPHLANKYYLYKDPVASEQIEHNQRIMRQLKQTQYTAIIVLNRTLANYHIAQKLNTQFIFGHIFGIRSMRAKVFCLFSNMNSKYHYIEYDDNIHEVHNQFRLLNLSLNVLNKHSCLQSGATLPTLQFHPEPNCYFYTAHYNPETANYHDAQRDIKKVIINISGRFDTVRYIPTALARCIIEDLLLLGKQVLIIATIDDHDRAQQLVTEVIDTVNKINPNLSKFVSVYIEADLLKLADIMTEYYYYIGADGGLLHVAAGLQMHCVGLFHVQNIQAWAPWSDKQICLQTASKRIFDIKPHEVITALTSFP